LLLCPFLLDFFSLFRGYGLGMAFWLVAIDGGIRYYRTLRERHLTQLLLALFVADMAVLSLVPLWALTVAIIAAHLFFDWRKAQATPPWRKILIWVFLGAFPLLIGLLLAWEMRRRGLLYHGTTEGFIPVTLASLSNHVLGTRHFMVLAITSVVIIGASLVLPLRKAWRSPLFVLVLLLWADVFMRIGMALLLDVNYPEDRAALHMVPLAICTIAFAADILSPGALLLKRAFMVLLLFLPIRTIATANLDHTQLWPEQSVPTGFLRFVEALGNLHDRPLMIGAYHQLGYALPYNARVNNIRINSPDVGTFPFGTHDIRIVDDRFLADAIDGYVEIDHAPGSGLHLLQREIPLETETTPWMEQEHGMGNTEEFVELWSEAGDSELFLEVGCVLSAPERFLNLFLVVSLEKDGAPLYYHPIPAAHFRREWQGHEYHVLARVPPIPADRRVIYFWNQDRVQIDLGTVHTRVHAPIIEKDAR
jgi:hypothetical protein